jgi:hypothetical protein
VAYSFTDAEEVNGLTSSRAISNWSSRSIFNPNEELASRSPYVNKDRFTGTVSYRHFFFDNYKTEFALFYEGRSGKPYSFTFNNDMNGDGLAGNDLMYLPTASQVVFTDPAERAVYEQLVQSYGLNEFIGSVVPRNRFFAPWVHNFDFRISQELPGFFADNKAEIWFDVLNVGNLINKDWGLIDEVGFQGNGGQARSFVNFAGVNASGQYVYDVLPTPEDFIRRDRSAESRWAVQLGFRYRPWAASLFLSSAALAAARLCAVDALIFGRRLGGVRSHVTAGTTIAQRAYPVLADGLPTIAYAAFRVGAQGAAA